LILIQVKVNMSYIKGDIHEVIKTIKTDSIDLIYTNPPFGITKKKWDTPLNWDELWIEIWRVMKPTGIVILHASMPFSYTLIKSQTPRYHYCIKKNRLTGHLGVKYQPLRQMEELYIFYKKPGCYNPQKVGDEVCRSNWTGSNGYYNPCKKGKPYTIVGKHPTTFINMEVNRRGGKTISDDVIDYVIKTYSNEGDTVLDMTTHNKVVGDRVEKLNRKFIGVDINMI